VLVCQNCWLPTREVVVTEWDTGFSFRVSWVEFMIRSVYRFFCSQTEAFTFVIPKTLGRWIIPGLHHSSESTLECQPFGVTETALWLLSPQKWFPDLPNIDKGQDALETYPSLNGQHHISFALHLASCFSLQQRMGFPLCWLLLTFIVISIDLCSNTCYDAGDKNILTLNLDHKWLKEWN
jgi:hypothetical protein